MPDEDGYPTDEELECIENWPNDDLKSWLAYIKVEALHGKG